MSTPRFEPGSFTTDRALYQLSLSGPLFKFKMFYSEKICLRIIKRFLFVKVFNVGTSSQLSFSFFLYIQGYLYTHDNDWSTSTLVLAESHLDLHIHVQMTLVIYFIFASISFYIVWALYVWPAGAVFFHQGFFLSWMRCSNFFVKLDERVWKKWGSNLARSSRVRADNEWIRPLNYADPILFIKILWGTNLINFLHLRTYFQPYPGDSFLINSLWTRIDKLCNKIFEPFPPCLPLLYPGSYHQGNLPNPCLWSTSIPSFPNHYEQSR
jgi:hypothetical protein